MQTNTAEKYDALSPEPKHHFDYAERMLNLAIRQEAEKKSPMWEKMMNMAFRKACEAEDLWYKLGGRRHTLTKGDGTMVAI